MNGFYERNYPVNSYNCDRGFNLRLSSLVEFLQDIALWHSNDVGCGFKEMAEMGFAWILYKWKIQVHSFPKLGDTLRVKTWSSGIDKRQAFRSFRVYDQSDKLVAEALSVWIVMSIEKRTISIISDDILSNFDNSNECLFKDAVINNPLSIAGNEISSRSYTVCRHDLDYNNHMNNAKYVEVFTDSLPDDFSLSECNSCDLEITYKRECPPDADLVCVCFEGSPDKIDNRNSTAVVAVIKQPGIENNRHANTFFKLIIN